MRGDSMKRPLAQTVAGYTRFVLLGRGFLWLMIGVTITLILYTASTNKGSDGSRLVFSNIKQMDDVQNVMENPHYHGLDKNNMPYSVIADRAVQVDADTVALQRIKADLEDKNGKWLALHAGAGEMKLAVKQLTLTKNVDMFYDGGYEFKTDRAILNIPQGSAHGDVPITGQGPLGTLRANSFSVLDRGSVIVFDGAVKVVLYRDK